MLLLSGRCLALLINLLVQVITIRYLAKADFGAFAFGVSMVALATNLTALGLPKSLARFIPIYQERGEVDKIAGALILVCGTVFGLGVAAVAFVLGLNIFFSEQMMIDSQSISLLLILIVLAPVESLDRVFETVFAVSGHVRAIFVRRHLLGPGLKLGAVLLVVAFGADVRWLAAFYVLAGVLGFSFYLTLVSRFKQHIPTARTIMRGDFQMPAAEIFSYSLPLISSQIGFVMRTSIVVMLLEWYCDSVSVADFRSVLPFARLNETVLVSFAIMFTPVASRMFARQEMGGISELYWRTSIWIMVCSLPVFLLTGVLANGFTPLALGTRYTSSGSILMILASGFFFDALLGFNVHTLRVYARVWSIVAVDVISIIACLAMSVILIPVHGAWGAGVTICVTTVLQNILFQVVMYMATGVGLMRWEYARLYLSAAATIGVLGFVQWRWSPPFLAAACIAAGLYGALLLTHRSTLQVDKTFPELNKFPFLARLLGSSQSKKSTRLSESES